MLEARRENFYDWPLLLQRTAAFLMALSQISSSPNVNCVSCFNLQFTLLTKTVVKLLKSLQTALKGCQRKGFGEITDRLF